MASRTALCVLLLYLAVLCYIAVETLTKVEARRHTHGNYPTLPEAGVGLVYVIPMVIAQSVCQRLFLPVASRVIVRKDTWSTAVYESKLARFGSAVFKLVFFVTCSACSWMYGLAEADWVPPALFGKGSTANCWGEGHAGDTQQPVGTAIARFYQVALAYHLSELVFQVLWEREKPDFVEMFAHHLTTTFLIFMSIILNFVRIGTLVLFLHHVSDIPVYGAKIFVDTRFKTITFLNLIGMLISWGYLRLYVLPAIIIRSTLLETGFEFAAWAGSDVEYRNYYGFNVGLGLLFCLHIYWYFLFLRMGYQYVVKRETKDIQANLTGMDPKAKASPNGVDKRD